MARISTYPVEPSVLGTDRWIGTETHTAAKLTKNFTPNLVAQYFNRSSVVDNGSFSWNYTPYSNTSNQTEATFSKEGLGDFIIDVNNLEGVIRVSSVNVANNSPGVYIENIWIGNYIKVQVPNKPSQYAIYRILNVIAGVDSYEWELEYIEGTSGEITMNAPAVFSYFQSYHSAGNYVPYFGATEDVFLGNYGIQSSYYQLKTFAPFATPSVGKIIWDDFYGTPSVMLRGGNVNLQMGQEVVALVHNETGAPLVDGQVVYISGSTGQIPNAFLASNTTELKSSITFGVVTEPIANNSTGYVTKIGLVNGLNTNAFIEGESIYLGSIPGTFTHDKPTAPNHIVFLGVVVKKSGGNGSIYVSVQNTQELSESSDVLINTPLSDQVLSLNSGLWKNRNLGDIAWSSATANTIASFDASKKLVSLSTSIYPNLTELSYVKGVTSSIQNQLDSKQIGLDGTGFVKSSGTSISYDNTSYYPASNPNGYTSNLGTVTSVDLSAPTGFTVTGNPITTSGTLALAFASGYSLPSDVLQASWSAKQDLLSGTGFVKSTAGIISYDTTSYYPASNPNGYTSNTGTVTSVNMSVPTGFAIIGNPITSAGTLAIAFDSGYSLPSNTLQSSWSAKQDVISLTTTGSSGSSTFSSNILNVPTYTLAGLGGQPLNANLTSLSGLAYASASFVKMTSAGTFSLDTNIYYLASNPSGYTSNVGTVTSVAALTLGTTGTDLSSTVANGTTTPVITLNVPTASATNRGALSSTDWSTFNSKQAALSGTGFVKSTAGVISYDTNTYLTTALAASTYQPLLSLTSGYIPKATGTSTLGNSLIQDNGSGIGISVAPSGYKFNVNGTSNLGGNVRTDGVISLEGATYFKSNGSFVGFVVNNSTDTDNNFISYDSTGDLFVRGKIAIGITTRSGMLRVYAPTIGDYFKVLDSALSSAQTSIQVAWNNGSTTTLAQVEVGAADSGGTGYRLLRVPN